MSDLTKILFGENIELFDSVDEIFELELAYLEYNKLSKNELLNRTAYIKSYQNKLSNHFLLYSNNGNAILDNRTPKTKNYFENGQFSTGYATHGLFPYRGKFHPQLIKGLINIIGIKKGETILDPMCGSGTANIEAALMGINSIAIDISPFCQFMSQVKYDSLSIDLKLLESIQFDYKKLFKFFSQKNVKKKIDDLDSNKAKIYNLLLLAFLDSLGYSKRVEKSTHLQLFEKVMNRYIKTIVDFIKNPYFDNKKLGKFKVISDADALNTKVKSETIDAVITSPPYSFAIDYIENDKSQLEYLGYSISDLKLNMIGLKGKTKQDKLNNYFQDMSLFCKEVSRVLKKDKYFIMIIGSNTNQTGGIRLEGNIIKYAKTYNLILENSILKPIKGLWNTMKDEYILFFKKL